MIFKLLDAIFELWLKQWKDNRFSWKGHQFVCQLNRRTLSITIVHAAVHATIWAGTNKTNGCKT